MPLKRRNNTDLQQGASALKGGGGEGNARLQSRPKETRTKGKTKILFYYLYDSAAVINIKSV